MIGTAEVADLCAVGEGGATLSRPKDMEIQDEYGVEYHRYWFNEDTGEVWCLAEAPNKEAAEAVHREAYGLVADEITEVKEGSSPVAWRV